MARADEVRSTGRSKGRGSTKAVAAKEKGKQPGGGDGEKGKQQARAKHLLDLRLEELTPAAKRIAAGDRVTVLGPGPRLVVLSPRGVLGLASREASEAMRAALAAAPGARLESLVSAADKDEVSVRITLLRAADAGRRAARGGARPVAKLAPEDAAAMAAAGRRGR
jgi:hypothetical protein